MLELFLAGGILMYPLALCSIVAVAIILERIWVLRRDSIAPSHLVNDVWHLVESNQLSGERINRIQKSGPLGRILIAGLNSSRHGRILMREQMEEEAAHCIHGLKRFLNMLGTIAVIAPLLGLLGTVLGMIEVFLSFQGGSSPTFMARGISQALLTTAFGLSLAIPALICHRFFMRKIEDLALEMEHQASMLVNLMFRSGGK